MGLMQLMGKDVENVAMNLESDYKKVQLWQKSISTNHSERKIGLKRDGRSWWRRSTGSLYRELKEGRLGNN